MNDLVAVKNDNTYLKLNIEELTLSGDDIYDNIYDLEINLNELNQYTRRENIELQNIPESVEQEDLENFVLDLFKSINLEVSSYDFVAMHWIGKYYPIKSRNVIVRFLNRSKAYFCLKNAKDLNKSSNKIYKRIFITENLCPTQKIF